MYSGYSGQSNADTIIIDDYLHNMEIGWDEQREKQVRTHYENYLHSIVNGTHPAIIILRYFMWCWESKKKASRLFFSKPNNT